MNNRQYKAKIFLAGGSGLAGSAIKRELELNGFFVAAPDRNNVDCTSFSQVLKYLNAFSEKGRSFDYMIIAAAKVGGIYANNTYRADFIRENLRIQMSCIDAAQAAGIKNLMFLGSSCVYPKMSPQPIPEDALLTSELEQTNQPYAIAKIAGIEMCRSYNSQYKTKYISVMPTNLYGRNDNFDFVNGHVIPSIMSRLLLAKAGSRNPELRIYNDGILIGGDGTPMREFMWIDDFAYAIRFIIERHIRKPKDVPDLINIGSGHEITIKGLAYMIKQVVGYPGRLYFDKIGVFNGTPRKVVDTTRLEQLGWVKSKCTGLRFGLETMLPYAKKHWKITE